MRQGTANLACKTNQSKSLHHVFASLLQSLYLTVLNSFIWTFTWYANTYINPHKQLLPVGPQQTGHSVAKRRQTGLHAAMCPTCFAFAAALARPAAKCNINSLSCSIWKFKRHPRRAVKSERSFWSHMLALAVAPALTTALPGHHRQQH